MAKQVHGNPKRLDAVDLTTYVFADTGASGTVTITPTVDAAGLEGGQSLFMDIGTGSSGGYVDLKEYWIINKSSGQIQVANSRENAALNIADLTASGSAGSGTLYPNVHVGGTIFVGTGGTVYARGIESSSYQVLSNVADGQLLPYMLGAVSASGTTASGIIKAYK